METNVKSYTVGTKNERCKNRMGDTWLASKLNQPVEISRKQMEEADGGRTWRRRKDSLNIGAVQL